MGVGEGELNDVVGQGLVLSVDPETVVVNLIVLLSVPKTQGIEPLRDFVVFTQGLFRCDNRKRSSWTYLDYQQLVLQLLPWDDAFYLPHVENHAVLARHIIKLESLLTNPLDAVGPRQRLGLDVHF